MSEGHHLTPSVFATLARGSGGVTAIEALRVAQLSKHLLFTKHLLGQWPGPADDRDAIVDTLDRARRRHPDHFGDVLGAPLVGAWAGIATRAASQGAAAAADFEHLGAVAVVAAAAAGVDAHAEVPIRDGVVSVPGRGAAIIDQRAETKATLTTRDGQLTVHYGRTIVHASSEDDEARWQPVRLLLALDNDQPVRIQLDDVDPYRHGHHAPPASRLTPAEFDRWGSLFEDAWQLLTRCLPERASEIALGLRTLVPLVQEDVRSARSATIRHAFGVFGLTRPPSPAEFAVTVVHEFQHSKLSAMLDLIVLTDPADRSLHFAPWRVDPRPLAGLLQGVYAFVGVADSWRALRSVDALSHSASAKFAEARLQVDRGLAALEASGGLTEDGRTLVAGLRVVTDEMLAEPVPATVAAAAERVLDATRQQWLARNGSSVVDRSYVGGGSMSPSVRRPRSTASTSG